MPDADRHRTRDLRSHFADDPEMGELVELFLTELPARARAIEEAAAQADASRLRDLAHQLKGAAGGYGFPTLGVAAGRVEAMAGDPSASIAVTAEEVRDLIDLCERATGKGAHAGR